MSLIDTGSPAPERRLMGLPEADLKAFVGDNADYYLPKWRIMEQTDSQIGWNWPAALMTSYWLLYRRMYAWFLVYFLVSLFFYFPGWLSGPLWFLVTTIVFGFYGDWLYLRYAVKKLTGFQVLMPDPAERRMAAARVGGVDWISPIVLAVFSGLGILALFVALGVALVALFAGLDWAGWFDPVKSALGVFFYKVQ